MTMIRKYKHALPLLALIITLSVNASVHTGKCGENATYRLEEDGTLYIEGYGDMQNFNGTIFAPWYNKRQQVLKVEISEGINSIGDYAFYTAMNLASVTIPSSVTSIGYAAFNDCAALTTITLPDSLTDIGEYAFWRCSALRYITIPECVTTLRRATFMFCEALTTLILPTTLTLIDQGALSQCTSLRHIYCQSLTPPKSYYDFTSTIDTDNCNLYVPKGTSESYASASQWMNFANIIEEEVPTTISPVPYDRNTLTFSSHNGIIHLTGLPHDVPLSFYTPSGHYLGKTTPTNGEAIFDATPSIGNIIIIKMYDGEIKIRLKDR